MRHYPIRRQRPLYLFYPPYVPHSMFQPNHAIILLFVRTVNDKNTPNVADTYMVPIFLVCILAVIQFFYNLVLLAY